MVFTSLGIEALKVMSIKPGTNFLTVFAKNVFSQTSQSHVLPHNRFGELGESK